MTNIENTEFQNGRDKESKQKKSDVYIIQV